MPRFYSNTAIATTLNGAITGANTTIVVLSTSGFPVSFPYTLVLDEGTATEELVAVTAAAGLTLTVGRASDGTAATAHASGATVKHVASAQDFREPQEHIAATTSVHGVSGSVVGTTSTQTLTGKSLSLTTNTVTGTLAELNTAITDTDVAGIAATQTLTNKTMSGASNTFSAIPSSAVTGLDTHTSGTSTHGATGAVVGTTNTQTLTNKTLTAPTINNASLTSCTLNTSAWNGTLSGATLSATSVSAGSVAASSNVSAVNGGCEIVMGYSGGGGLSIAAVSDVATHINGVVLWVNGTTLYARKSNGTNVAIA